MIVLGDYIALPSTHKGMVLLLFEIERWQKYVSRIFGSH